MVNVEMACGFKKRVLSKSYLATLVDPRFVIHSTEVLV